jgi:RHS repeat-associated protein
LPSDSGPVFRHQALAGNVNYRTNNALVETFSANSDNELTTISRSGTATVVGTTTGYATNVTVNGVSTNDYADNTFAVAGFTLTNGNNAFTAIAQDAYGRKSTNTVVVNIPSSASYQYDSNGNLLYDGNRAFQWDDENELVQITVTNVWMSQFSYDGMLRRRIRKEFSWVSSAWVETNEVHSIYDGNLVIQERDANNLPVASYTRGLDLNGTLQGAGGIGGLLARTDNSRLNTGDPLAEAYYHADGNGNITCLVYTNQDVAARYSYDAFGNTLSASGPLAAANLYQFSSKELHPTSGLSYYLYRFYDPGLQRWLNRDPIGGPGGFNLYTIVRNDPVLFFDYLGLVAPGGYGRATPPGNQVTWAGCVMEVSTIGLGAADSPQMALIAFLSMMANLDQSDAPTLVASPQNQNDCNDIKAVRKAENCIDKAKDIQKAQSRNRSGINRINKSEQNMNKYLRDIANNPSILEE